MSRSGMANDLHWTKWHRKPMSSFERGEHENEDSERTASKQTVVGHESKTGYHIRCIKIVHYSSNQKKSTGSSMSHSGMDNDLH